MNKSNIINTLSSPTISDFGDFKKQYPNYQKTLWEYTEFLHDAYNLVCSKRFLRISKSSDFAELTNKFAFGMLLRHAVEAVTAAFLNELGVDFSDKTLNEKLEALKEYNIYGYNAAAEKALYIAKGYANEIAHPNLLDSGSGSLYEMQRFYFSRLEPLLTSHIEAIENLPNSIFKNGLNKKKVKTRRVINKYLIAIKNELDNFNIKNKVTYILLRSCLVRHLTECTVNLWCLEEKIAPTDYYTASMTDSLHAKLVELSKKLDKRVIDNLFLLKNTSNRLMHVDVFKIKHLLITGVEITRLHPIVENECSPNISNLSLPSLITTLLCGFTGWLGTHQFYSGNTAKGFAFLFTGGLVFFPIVSLNNLRCGRFYSKKWGPFPKHPLITVLSTLFIALHIGLYIFILVNLFLLKQ